MSLNSLAQHSKTFWILQDQKRLEQWSFDDPAAPYSVLDIPAAYAFAIHPGAETAAISVQYRIVLIDLSDGRELLSIPQERGEPAMGLLFSPDGNLLMAGFQWGEMKTYNAKTLELIAESETGDYPIYGLLHPGNKHCCWSVRYDLAASLMIYELGPGNLELISETENLLDACAPAFNKNGTLLACGDAYAFKLFSFPEMELTMAFFPSGERVPVEQVEKLPKHSSPCF